MTRILFSFLLLLSFCTPFQSHAQTSNELLDLIKQQAAKIKQLEKRLERLEGKTPFKTLPENEKIAVVKAKPEDKKPKTKKDKSPIGLYGLVLHGRLQLDSVAFNAKKNKDGFKRDFNSGLAFRRVRLDVYGRLSDDLRYQVRVDFANPGRIIFDDSYVQYEGWSVAKITLGEQKIFNALDVSTGDHNVVFMERAMPTIAFIGGAGGKLGLSTFSNGEDWSVQLGIMTDSANKRTAGKGGWGLNSRFTYSPVIGDGKILHVGADFYYRIETDGILRFSERPEIAVDNTRLVDTGPIAAREYSVAGVEAAGIWGPFSIQSEYHRADVWGSEAERHSFWGAYVAASYFLTGEDTPFQSFRGGFARPLPLNPISEGGMGAVQMTARYSYLDLQDKAIGNRMRTYTLGLNWLLTSHSKLVFNYIHFDVDGGLEDKGNAFGMRMQTDW